ncbi:hypothetical protein [Cohnella kolymensis]|uniref:hypothetical protein n=1 Tax=Cohnella kolymensis TaxID=1590652 RepID=UPI0006983F51|nr:hypothetical protein [Cohnella kolymensis]
MNPQKRTDRANDVFELALYILAAVCFIYFWARGIHFKMLQPVLIVVVLTLIRLTVRWTRTELFPALRFSILFFITLTMFIANLFGFYGVIPYLDKVEHLLSGIILCFVGLLIYKKTTEKDGVNRPSSGAAVWFALFFAAAMAGCWEIYEFTTDRIFGLHSQNDSLVDTMADIICGDIGAAATAVYLFRKAKRKQMPLIDVK